MNGNAPDPQAECDRLGEASQAHPIDVALAGIGENGHLAFNDHPADFDIGDPYLVVTLDEVCRNQQLGEGWFPALDDVPSQAISMSIRQIMKSRHLVLTVPDKRKAVAVKVALEGKITPECPSSIIQRHENCDIFMDSAAA